MEIIWYGKASKIFTINEQIGVTIKALEHNLFYVCFNLWGIGYLKNSSGSLVLRESNAHT